MKHQVSTLTGALLDAAVALAEGHAPEVAPYRVREPASGITFVRDQPVCTVNGRHYEPSTDWSVGGPIIDRFHISVECFQDTAGRSNMRDVFWAGTAYGGTAAGLPRDGSGEGETALIAAMRAYVYAKLGPEVKLP